MAPSVCQSPADCVKNELLPFLPDSTLARLNDTESCQNSTLAWIADSGLSLERIRQRYALAVLACEMNLSNDPTGFSVNECEWLDAITDDNSCNGDDIVESLLLSNKQITGTLPPELSILSNIMVINFSFNQIYGTIPSELGYLTLLQALKLNNNNLSESMPKEVCALRNFPLETLVVDCSLDVFSQPQQEVNCDCCSSCV